MKKIIIIYLCLCIGQQGFSQANKYWVYYTDKADMTLNARAYFSVKALERRTRNHVAWVEFTDLPVNPVYSSAVNRLADSLLGNSRWLNASCIYAGKKAADKIKTLPFVKSVIPIKSQAIVAGFHTLSKHFNTTLPDNEKKLAYWQTERMGNSYFKQNAYTGKGILIAVFDVGFPKVNTHPAFSHLYNKHQILETHDFITGKENVYHSNGHGKMVLSCIAGRIDSLDIGLAPEANFILARTERFLSEWGSEEQNWIFAAEWADRLGADIISSSLGYSKERYFQQDMNGETAPISKAANIAARKGILVISAAGNENQNSWATIVAPSDADSVLSIGGTNPYTDYRISFSSPGPTADRRLKPNVSAYGEVVAAVGSNAFARVEGTSFATPLVAGFAACLMQAYPNKKAMDIFQLIEKSAHLYPYFDYAHGYGIPQATHALNPIIPIAPTFSFRVTEDTIFVQPDSLVVAAHPEWATSKNLYFEIINGNNFIYHYGVAGIEKNDQFKLSKNSLSYYTRPAWLRIHFEGYTNQLKLEE